MLIILCGSDFRYAAVGYDVGIYEGAVRIGVNGKSLAVHHSAVPGSGNVHLNGKRFVENRVVLGVGKSNLYLAVLVGCACRDKLRLSGTSRLS